ncbi:hypothetical protein HYV31_01610 [candidate division WWE3 bacterium]|nr:hypothetical protein [candidate division WWE3 bacterium]
MVLQQGLAPTSSNINNSELGFVPAISTPDLAKRSSQFEKLESIREFIVFPHTAKNDPTEIFAVSEESAIFVHALIANHKESAKHIELAFECVAKLYEDESLKPYFESPSFSGYLRFLEALDEKFLDNTNPTQPGSLKAEDDPFTNHTVRFAKHLFTVAYVKKLIAGSSDKNPNSLEVLKIMLSETLMTYCEIQELLEDSISNKTQELNRLGKGKVLSVEVNQDNAQKLLARSMNVVSTIGMYFFKDPRTNMEMEGIFAGIRQYYLDRAESKKENTTHLNDKKKRSLNMFEKTEVGVRSEILAFGFLTEITKTLNARLVQSNGEVVDIKQDAYDDFLLEANKFLKANPKRFFVMHSSPELDYRGVADLCIAAEIDDGVNKVILLSEVKVEDIVEKDRTILLATGTHPMPRNKAGKGRRPPEVLSNGQRIWKDIPEAVAWYVDETLSSVASIRIAKDLVSDGTITNRVEGLVRIGGYSHTAALKNLRGVVSPSDNRNEEKAKVEETKLTMTKILTQLLKHQTLARG